MAQLFPIIVSLILLAFWAWMLRDMVSNDRIVGNARYLWILGFVFLSVLTAGYYYFTEYKKT